VMEGSREQEIIMCESSRRVKIVLQPVWTDTETFSISMGGFVLNELVWDKTHQCIGQVMAFYDRGELRLDSDGVVSLDDIEPLRECHFSRTSSFPPSISLRMALTLQNAQKNALKQCVDCGDYVTQDQGRYYKYEPGVWLCDSCHDDRIEEN